MIFKCKICGGSLNVKQGERVTECEYCGVKQTLPNFIEPKVQEMYDRASSYLMHNEFDKAENLYNQILFENKEDADAYWNVLMCRYGVTYVKDPASGTYIPTCNRTLYAPIFNDENYQNALKYADEKQKALFMQNAETIDKIQKGILAISQKEEPFDVFICYKETDESGRRTQDSVLANDLYHQLTQEGFKVFFARITLEDKLGQEYEPYIFAALNSAKVMVVLGTNPEHFNAVWVKNEWSRFLALIKNGADKMLIPAYRDMNPYDLPEEFASLQAQDMSKLGFMQDLIRGIKKLTNTESATTLVKETTVIGSTNTEAILKRVFMSLEDGDFKRADALCEQVLNTDPENALAYLGKLMAELKVKNRASLGECAISFENSNNYQKLLSFADNSLKQELSDALQSIEKRKALNTEEKSKLLKRIAKIATPIIAAVIILVFVLNIFIVPLLQYNKAIQLRDEGQYEESKQLLTKLGDYKDASILLKKFIMVPTKVSRNASNTTVYIYDERGNIIKEEHAHDRYGEKTVKSYTYNEQNQLIEQKRNDTVTALDNSAIVEYTYNEQGQLARSNSMLTDSDWSGYTEFHYDEYSNLIKREIYDSYTEGIYATTEYTYDEYENCIKEYNIDPYSVSSKEFQYDESGNCVLRKESYALSYSYESAMIYDDNGNCLKENVRTLNPDGSIVSSRQTEYYYDENNNCVKEVRDSYLPSGYTIEYIFNEQNHCTKMTRIEQKDKSESVDEYSYEYALIYRESDEPLEFDKFGLYELPEIYS